MYKNNKAFTLIEVIVTLVILAIIVMVAIPFINSIKEKSREKSYRLSVDKYGHAIELALNTYELEYGDYPNSIDDLKINYSGNKVDCKVIRIRKDGSVYLSECYIDDEKVGDKKTYDKFYHYGKSDYDYVDEYGIELERASLAYLDKYGDIVDDYNRLSLSNNIEDVVNCSVIVNYNGTIYMTQCKVNNIDVTSNTEEDGYYHYGLDKSTAVKALLSKSNGASVTRYSAGNVGEMYTFSHPATEQTGELTDYRYIGANPNNYVTFNNELWRIIGVFTVEDGNGNQEQRIKIVRNEKLSADMAWNSIEENEWGTSTLNTYLNGEYYNGLDEASKNMVADTKYYLGGNPDYKNLKGEDYYNFERGTTVYPGRSFSWVGQIGLMYPSDYAYTYALGVDNTCYTTGSNCLTDQGGIPTKGWIYNTNSNSTQWLLSPHSLDYSGNFVLSNFGGILDYHTTKALKSIRPTLYLISDIKIDSGDGSEQNPYRLKL